MAYAAYDWEVATYVVSGNNAYASIQVPFSFRLTGLASGSHSFGFAVAAEFRNATDNLQTAANVYMNVVGTMHAQENKI